MEVFYDILTELQKESIQSEPKPTRIQQKCNMSYDKFSKNLNELKKRGLVSDNSSLRITDKGIQLVQDYSKINNFLTEMKLEYLEVEINNAS